MALKDWKRYQNDWIKPSRYYKIEGSRIIFIQPQKYYAAQSHGSKAFCLIYSKRYPVGPYTSSEYIADEKFKTFAQALKFAKEYMKKH